VGHQDTMIMMEAMDRMEDLQVVVVVGYLSHVAIRTEEIRAAKMNDKLCLMASFWNGSLTFHFIEEYFESGLVITSIKMVRVNNLFCCCY